MTEKSDDTKTSDNQMHFRFDFIFENISLDEKTHTFRCTVRPDPRRYEWQSENGLDVLYDKFDNILFPKHIVKQFAESLLKHPINYEPQKIGDTAQYVKSRLTAVMTALNGDQPPPTFADPSDEFLLSLAADKLEFVILSLDIVGSTAMATSMPTMKYTRILQTALREISELVPLFNGHVLKYTGDGIIAYFPAPSFITKNDLALDCALSLCYLVKEGLNPTLLSCGYTPINIRIGLDSGEAAVVVIGSSATKQHKDILGSVISLACKIQARAPIGGIALGDVTMRNLHTRWRMMCNEMDMGPEWDYADRETGKRYRVHKVQFG